MDLLGIDHVGLHVRDLAASLTFYAEVLGMPPIDRPDLGFPGAWLRVGPTQELHLLQRGAHDANPPRERHWSILVRDVAAWSARLTAHGVPADGPRPRPDGAQQLFVRDPDGHVLELLERRAEAPR